LSLLRKLQPPSLRGSDVWQRHAPTFLQLPAELSRGFCLAPVIWNIRACAEINALESDDIVPAGGTYRETVDQTGHVKFQCCIHPWIRQEALSVQLSLSPVQKGAYGRAQSSCKGPENLARCSRCSGGSERGSRWCARSRASCSTAPWCMRSRTPKRRLSEPLHPSCSLPPPASCTSTAGRKSARTHCGDVHRLGRGRPHPVLSKTDRG
jgi:hypothetical protein